MVLKHQSNSMTQLLFAVKIVIFFFIFCQNALPNNSFEYSNKMR